MAVLITFKIIIKNSFVFKQNQFSASVPIGWNCSQVHQQVHQLVLPIRKSLSFLPYFSSAIFLSHGKLRALIEGIALFSRRYSCFLYIIVNHCISLCLCNLSLLPSAPCFQNCSPRSVSALQV